jgi:hypothetical protein
MNSLNNISQTLITLEVGKTQVSLILLSEDGSINRKGDGKPNCNDNNFFIGKTKDKIFEQLKPLINEEMQDFLGKSFDIPEKKGRVCNLKILFKSGESETGVQFYYGEFSQGPPTVFKNFTIKAIELTENWHQQQKQMILKSKPKETNTKPWWKLW